MESNEILALRESRSISADRTGGCCARGTPETLLLDFKTLGLLFESLALHDCGSMREQTE